jgi:hypothetical protein
MILGKQVDMFDSSNPGSQSDANEVLAQVAKLLGVDDPQDTKALQTAFASLLEAAGGDGTESADDQKTTGAQYPKVVDKNAVRRGRELLGWKK